MSAEKRAWVVTEGHIGLVNQGTGLAEATGFRVETRNVRLRPPWAWIPPDLMPPPLSGVACDGPGLTPPWPDLLVSVGRRSAAVSIAVRRASGGRTFTVHLQNPHASARHFDLIALPRHDLAAGVRQRENVIFHEAALHRVTAARLAEALAGAPPALLDLPGPRIVVLVGGSNGRYRFGPAEMRELAGQLLAVRESTGGSLLVSTSRRTGAENVAALRAALGDNVARFWAGEGENPYFSWLALADALLVTCDSVSMISEACATGRPVQVMHFPGGSRRFAAFHRSMEAAGYVRPFRGRLETWSCTPPDDTARIAAEVRRRMSLRNGGGGTGA